MAYFLSIIFLCLFYPYDLSGKDLGTYGHTFPIAETSLLEHIKNKVSRISKEETFGIFEKMRNEYIERIREPRSVGLKECKTPRISYYDPTICLSSDIKDAQGKVIIPRGATYNPLSTTVWREDLLFFDGSDPKQVDWAKKNHGKWILTGGRPLDLEKSENRPVYFDQMGTMSKKLGIQATPAKVSQEGFKLKIEEIPCF